MRTDIENISKWSVTEKIELLNKVHDGLTVNHLYICEVIREVCPDHQVNSYYILGQLKLLNAHMKLDGCWYKKPRLSFYYKMDSHRNHTYITTPRIDRDRLFVQWKRDIVKLAIELLKQSNK